ncbi:MAG TPA: 16S rRNA (guanine(966)-N(2))-methyltransferase RsmD [Candidatus Polarisedimenticolia bacterium]|nr:16S rRNA (guanine(966)-N(2))-methyltransferase RsmD [Candidatus Polarisedimenticolia bacterium]
MRLTGGESRGRRLKGPRGLGMRPTSDRVREAIFDILRTRVERASFLDGYAGTGAVGIEALSRGAGRVVFLERDRRALRLIRENLGIGSWAGSSEVIEGDAERSLGRLGARPERFAIVFLDPPYDLDLPVSVLGLAGDLVTPAGVLLVEHRSTRPPEAFQRESLQRRRVYRYGDTSLTLFARGGGQPAS